MQRASQGKKYGDTGNHKTAVKNVIQFIKEHNPKIDIYEGWLVKYNPHFVRREKITWTPEHEYDIAILVPQRTIVLSDYTVYIQYYLEIDGESHGKENIRGHEQRKIKDGIAVKHANESGIQVIRLDKTECLGAPKERNEYLNDELGRFIK